MSTESDRPSRTTTIWIWVIEAFLWAGWALAALVFVPQRTSRVFNNVYDYMKSQADTSINPNSIARSFVEAAKASQKTQDAAVPWLIAVVCALTLVSAAHAAYALRSRARTLHLGQLVLMWIGVAITLGVSRMIFGWIADGALEGIRFRLQILVASLDFAVPLAAFVIAFGLTWAWFGARSASHRHQ